MIAESAYWKEDLARWAQVLERRRSARCWTDRSHARVEKAAMLGCFAIRRLIESGGRLSDTTIRLPIQVRTYRRKSDYMTSLNRDQIDRHIALQRPEKRAIAPRDLVNQFIHSHVFAVVQTSTGGLYSILVTSDRGRHQTLFEVSATALIRAFRRASRDRPTRLDGHYDENRRDFVWCARP